MYLTLRSLYFNLRSSFWFIPALIALAALVAAPLSLHADFQFGTDVLTRWLPGPKITQEGARAVLSTIAGSMMTVASLVFSMTLVALSLVSQQLGPRVLQFFMEDGPTKIVLGAFIGTFLFALIVLGTVGSPNEGAFVPRFSVFVTGALAVVSFVLMIFFVHHISTQIQADVIISKLGDQFARAVKSHLDCEDGNPMALSHEEYAEVSRLYDNGERDIEMGEMGYVASIDEAQCLAIAEKGDLRIRMKCRPGHFVFDHEPVMSVGSDTDLDDDVIKALRAVVGIQPRRTREQHVEFEINALCEVALRALSPGINDPYTAMSCIDSMSEGLALFLERGPDLRVLRDEANNIRVLLYPQEFEHYLNTAFHPIRQAAAKDPQTLLRLLYSLRELGHISQTEVAKDAIRSHIDAIEETCDSNLSIEHDKKMLRDETQQTREAIARTSQPI